jgi:hypothetical protein
MTQALSTTFYFPLPKILMRKTRAAKTTHAGLMGVNWMTIFWHILPHRVCSTPCGAPQGLHTPPHVEEENVLQLYYLRQPIREQLHKAKSNWDICANLTIHLHIMIDFGLLAIPAPPLCMWLCDLSSASPGTSSRSIGPFYKYCSSSNSQRPPSAPFFRTARMLHVPSPQGPRYRPRRMFPLPAASKDLEPQIDLS